VLKKLRIKFICFTMALVFVMLSIIFGMVYGFTAENLENDSLQLMRSIGTPRNRPTNREPNIRTPYLVLQQNMQGVWTAQGNGYYDLEDQAFLTDLLQAVSEETHRSGVLREYDLRYMRTESPSVQYVFMDISAERTTLRHLVRTCGTIGVASLALFFIISVFLARWAIRPVEIAWEQQKQFIADASHELKTPLAVILTNAELLAEESYSPQERQKFGQNILTMTHQMRHLVESLLELARLDNVTPVFEPLNLSALAETALLPFEPVFFEQEMLLECDLLPGLWVNGSASYLQQVIEIFLDNARKYSDPGTVTVKLDKAGSHALLQVENPGIPLSDDEAKNIFRRFYRTDASRCRDGSYGLGLSIAQRITEQHGGKIWAEGTASGNRFSLLLPLSHREPPEKHTELANQ